MGWKLYRDDVWVGSSAGVLMPTTESNADDRAIQKTGLVKAKKGSAHIFTKQQSRPGRGGVAVPHIIKGSIHASMSAKYFRTSVYRL